MDIMKNKKVAYCVDFVTVHRCTKFRSHICNIRDFTEGALCAPRYYKGPKSPVLTGLMILEIVMGSCFPGSRSCYMVSVVCGSVVLSTSFCKFVY